MRLLLLNENQRSELMRKLVTAFQEKVLLCFDHFNPELTLSCLRIVTSLSALKPHTKTLRTSCKSLVSDDGLKSPSCHDPFAELDMEDAMTRELPIFTTSRLRGTVQQILRRASLRQDGTLYFAESSKFATATKSVQYFVWFFDFMDYLQELHCNFTEKIFSPLFRYFYDDNFLGPNGRTNTMSSAFSKTSQFSESEKQNGNDFDDTDSSAERAQILEQSKASLLQLSREFRDIKSIYDTTELTKIAERMSFVKEQLDYLFGEEDEVDPEIYSEESGKMVEHLDMDFGTENLIRLVPDILVKLRKAAWLAGRWLDLDDQRTKDVNEKLDKLVLIEEKLTDRLNSLNTDIANGEKKLERETDELSRLMEKEGRFDVLTFQTYDIDTHIKKLQKKVTQLNAERQQFVPKLAAIVKAKNLNEFQKLKFMFESNKLQRFLTERKLATLHYQRNLLADDLNIDLYVRPSVIHCTNRLQDDCEHLEKQLREKRVEMVSIKRALMPVQEDKASLMHRISRERHRSSDWRTDTSSARLRKLLLYPGNAVYIRSFPGTQFPVGFSRPVRRDPRSALIRRIPLRNNRSVESPPAW